MADRSAVGIDFGTTNSSVGLATGGPDVTLARFQHERGATEAYRSLLYLEHVKQDPNVFELAMNLIGNQDYSIRHFGLDLLLSLAKRGRDDLKPIACSLLNVS